MSAITNIRKQLQLTDEELRAAYLRHISQHMATTEDDTAPRSFLSWKAERIALALDECLTNTMNGLTEEDCNEVLDELVCYTKCGEAAAINNEGTVGQVTYLIERGHTVEEILEVLEKAHVG